jgi:NADH-quinone oxidoreductase subunit M
MLAMMDPHNFTATGILSPFNPNNLRLIAYLALFVGFAIKIPMFPFHTWLPDAHVEAPTAISVILAGVLLKMGTYGILRVCFPIFPEITKDLMWYIALFGMINIIYGAFCAMAQKDFKKLIAYSSVSHMGFVLLGMASLTTIGISGAVLQMFNHGTITAMLFIIVGIIYDRAHTRGLEDFGGLATQMPIYTGFVRILRIYRQLRRGYNQNSCYYLHCGNSAGRRLYAVDFTKSLPWQIKRKMEYPAGYDVQGICNACSVKHYSNFYRHLSFINA